MKPYIESASAAALEWVRSSYSGTNGNCVEAAALPDGTRALRDSKNPHGPALLFTPTAFHTFLHAAITGEFGKA